MKTRDEFIKSVREKSEIAMAEKEAARADKKIKQKNRKLMNQIKGYIRKFYYANFKYNI